MHSNEIFKESSFIINLVCVWRVRRRQRRRQQYVIYFQATEKTCEILFSRLYFVFFADPSMGTMHSDGTRIAAMHIVEHRFWLVYCFRERIKLVHFSQHSINASCMNIERREKHDAHCTHTWNVDPFAVPRKEIFFFCCCINWRDVVDVESSLLYNMIIKFNFNAILLY